MRYLDIADLVERVRANVEAIHVCKSYYMSHAYREVRSCVGGAFLEKCSPACNQGVVDKFRCQTPDGPHGSSTNVSLWECKPSRLSSGWCVTCVSKWKGHQ